MRFERLYFRVVSGDLNSGSSMLHTGLGKQVVTGSGNLKTIKLLDYGLK